MDVLVFGAVRGVGVGVLLVRVAQWYCSVWSFSHKYVNFQLQPLHCYLWVFFYGEAHSNHPSGLKFY